jgi:hypothetical protein
LNHQKPSHRADARHEVALQFHTLLILLTVSLLPVSGLLAGVSATRASETRQEVYPDDQVPAATLLPPVMVLGQREPLTDASRTIDRNTIGSFPVGNSSINEILSILPDIQFSETSNLSTQGGEILPPSISISGGKGFENNFVIDGLSNNSFLDPDADNPLDNNNVPGHAQEVLLDASLVEQITVYDSNVPASYGDFKGGVVHATTLEPRHRFGGNLFYRTTRDSWTEFHIARSEKEKFENSEDHTRQPKFEKHHAGFDVHVPVTSDLRLLSSYRLLLSTIPLQNLGESRKQQRRQENFLVKLACEPTLQSRLDLAWTYSPYEGKYFKKDFKNSDFTVFGGAYMLNANYRTALSFADLNMQAGYTESENSREGPAHMIQTKNPDNSWDKEGFTGDIEKNQQNFQWKTDLLLHPTVTGPITHELNLGVDFQNIRGTSRRDKTSYIYTYLANGITWRNVYEHYQAEAILRQYSMYTQDILQYKRLELRPGLRLSYDDFMRNFNLAPRLAVGLDIFGHGNTVLIGGINRYYANTLLTYKLRQDTPASYLEQWSAQDGWTLKSGPTTANSYASLKTPYADEYVIGLEQHLLGGKATLKYVQRNGRDEFAKTFSDKQPDGKFYSSLNNNGYSRHESYRLSWERQWHHHYLRINGTYQETTSSNESYDDLLNDDDLDEEIWYNGHVIPKSQLPRKDFNRPWLINLLYVGQLPHNITFSSLLKYRSGYQALQKSGQMHADLGIPIYQETKLGGATIVDCKIDWRTRLWARQELLLSLEVLNLLDKKAAVGGREDEYEMGRQFWLGAQYFF